MTTNKTDAAGSASASTDELGGWTQLADGRWMPPPKPEDQPSAVQCWYMRDDHSFCRLPLDVELALAEMRAERDIGNTYGMLCGAPKPLFLDVVHAGCAKDWEKFEGAARQWLERAVRLGTPPNACSPANPVKHDCDCRDKAAERGWVMFDSVIKQVPQLARGIVWCRECGKSQRVDSGRALSNGWPKCCGYTMTIDSPEEQAKFRQAAEREE